MRDGANVAFTIVIKTALGIERFLEANKNKIVHQSRVAPKYLKTVTDPSMESTE